MKFKAMMGLAAALLLGSPSLAKQKEPAPCVVYFAVVENDETTVHLSMVGLNKSQRSWYEKHGDRDKLAGICYVEKAMHLPVRPSTRSCGASIW